MQFSDLYVGDRFIAHASLWTKLSHNTARRHDDAGRRMGAQGFGYRYDTICSFAREDDVQFEAPSRASSPPSVLDGTDRTTSGAIGQP